MIRSELVAKLAARFPQLQLRDVEFATKLILDRMSDALIRGQRIEIRNFGSFDLNHRPARTGRNPRNGNVVAIPAKLAIHYKPGKSLRERVAIKKPAI